MKVKYVRRLLAFSLSISIAFAPSPLIAAAQPTVEWIRELGTSGIDRAKGIVADAQGNVYVGGGTTGAISGSNWGGLDGFLQKYNAGGEFQWSRQLGTSQYDQIEKLAVDKAGNVYFSGTTEGSLAGPSLGNGEAIVGKYDFNGTLQWMHQIGTPYIERGTGVAVDLQHNVYLSGRTSGNLAAPLNGNSDAFVSKFDPTGTLLWTRQWGISRTDEGNDVAVDSIGNVYVAGSTFNFLSDPYPSLQDAFLNKYNTSGNLEWSRISGTHDGSFSYGVSVDDSGGVYQTGYTTGNVGGPNADGPSPHSSDAFVIKYDTSGTVLWKQQWGNTFNEVTTGISAGAPGEVYISGYTDGGTPAIYGDKDYDPFLSKIDVDGTLVWALQLGSGYSDFSTAVSADSTGNAYFAGYTSGNFGGTQFGNEDAFLMKIRTVPEPSTAVLLITVMLAIHSRRREKVS